MAQDMYHGQEIFNGDIQQDDLLLKNIASQINRFATFIYIVLVVVLLLMALLRRNEFAADDWVILIGVLLLLAFVYYKLRLRLMGLQEDEIELDDEQFTIYEYGISFPSFMLVNSKMPEQSGSQDFVSYNDIVAIETDERNILFKCKAAEYSCDLDYFPLSNQDYADDQLLRLFIDMVTRIKENLGKIENRDHPTIIPRAYFRDLI